MTAGKRLFLSTLSLRRATVALSPKTHHRPAISIHALLAESDLNNPKTVETRYFISIHALLAESDFFETVQIAILDTFLSTLSLRRATTYYESACPSVVYFYPRSPCGERHGLGLIAAGLYRISIHALLAESDSKSAQNSGALLRI